MADDTDLDQLVGELNQSSKSVRVEPRSPLHTPRLEEWLEVLTARGIHREELDHAAPIPKRPEPQ